MISKKITSILFILFLSVNLIYAQQPIENMDKKSLPFLNQSLRDTDQRLNNLGIADNQDFSGAVQGSTFYFESKGKLQTIAPGTLGQFFMTGGSDANPSFSFVKRYVGTFSRDMTIASGTQSITDPGFQPNGVIFFAVQSGQDEMSVGFDDGTTGNSIIWKNSVTASSWGIDSNDSISITQGTGLSYEGNISAFASTGFTITWVRTGATTGTMDVIYMAFR